MKLIRIAVLLAGLCAAACFKDVSHRTDYVLKPLRQQASGDAVLPVAAAAAYAFDADSTSWKVASYEDAAAGILTSKSSPGVQLSPMLTAEPYADGELEHLLRMPLDKRSQMVVAVDTEDRLYAYTQQELPVNLPTLYVALVFKPWKEGNAYKEGKWVFRNDFYTPPVELDCFVEVKLQRDEGGAETPLAGTNLRVYAYAADTTEWFIASMADAWNRIITSKTSSLTRTNPDFLGYQQSGTDLYRFTATAPKLMVVAADQSQGVYAYSQQTVDLEGESPTFSVVLRTWPEAWITVENGWRIVLEAHAPDLPDEQPENTRRR